MKKGNLFALIPGNLNAEVFEPLVENERVRIERIISNGHTSPDSGWYDQERNEWVMILKGDACIAFKEGEIIELHAGDYLAIPAHKKHKVIKTSSDSETIWLAVHYAR
jgi:cupin 2 domain-containing protein